MQTAFRTWSSQIPYFLGRGAFRARIILILLTSHRWWRCWPSRKMSWASSRRSCQVYLGALHRLTYVGKIATDLTAARPSKGTAGSAIYNETNDPVSHSWAVVLSWILDVLFRGKLPLHNLVPDPETLPSKSVRIFFIDQIWLKCVGDGALSLANHLEPDDDSIKKEVKRQVNRYLANTLGEGTQAQKPRLPRWRFFIRSAVVSAFPDLRIEIPTKEKPSNSDVLLMQRVGEDVLMVLSDRIPGEATFSNVVPSRPGHQNGYALGDEATGLTKAELTLTFQRLPASPDSFNYDRYESNGPVQQM